VSPIPIRSMVRGSQWLCVANNSGASLLMNVSWASVHGL
jgi:hypothetical protein